MHTKREMSHMLSPDYSCESSIKNGEKTPAGVAYCSDMCFPAEERKRVAPQGIFAC